MKINALGAYSGIDQSSIDQLMAIEKRPLVQLSQRKTTFETQRNAWNDIGFRMNNLMNSIKDLSNTSMYNKMGASKSSQANISVKDSVQPQSFTLNIKQLATESRIVGEKIENQSLLPEVEIPAEMMINNTPISLLSKAYSIQDVISLINLRGEETGVKAGLIDNRLVLRNIHTGAKEISVSGDSALMSAIGLQNSETTQGQNAIIEIDGITVERETNTFENVIEGVQIKLNKDSKLNTPETITISKDDSELKNAVSKFVEQYNSTMSFIQDKSSRGEGARGPLAGDGTLSRLETSLKTLMNSRYDGKTLMDAGIATKDKSGVLFLDEKKLLENPGVIQDIFKKGNKIESYINTFASSNGIIHSVKSGYDRNIKDIDRQVQSFTERMERKEKYYINMFSKLDTAMMNAESQMNWLQSQINAFSSLKK